MKLRNKKTGVITEAYLIIDEPGIRRYADSIKDLCNNYEDYKPNEPLIKDEKIRKAVRAWAEANNIDRVSYYKSSHFWYLRSFNDHEQAIDFWLSYNAEPKLIENKSYTIDELCGEEK